MIVVSLGCAINLSSLFRKLGKGQLLATGLIYTRQRYIVLVETQKFTKTDS